MNSGLMTVCNNDVKHFIDDPEYSFQYRIWIISGNEGNTLNPTTTQVSTSQLDGVSNSHVFTDITICAYIIPVKCNIRILNARKCPTKSFGLVIIKIPKINMIIILWSSYYMPQNPQSIISQTTLKHCNQVRSVRTETLRWVKITTDTVMKLKV